MEGVGVGQFIFIGFFMFANRDRELTRRKSATSHP